MTQSVLAQLAALKEKSLPELKAMWAEMFDRSPPASSRPYLESRLAYRIQELAYGGLSKATRERLKAIAEELDPRNGNKRFRVDPDRPVAGTRLIREWQGVEHTATVTRDGFEYLGRPYKSLSAIARAITGVRWNGPMFFGLRSSRRK